MANRCSSVFSRTRLDDGNMTSRPVGPCKVPLRRGLPDWAVCRQLGYILTRSEAKKVGTGGYSRAEFGASLLE